MRLGLVMVAVISVLATSAGPAAAAPARIAFSSGDDLYTINADGSARSQLTTLGPRRSAFEPAWSPDGSRIVFSSAGKNGLSRIWTVGADGTGARPLTPLRRNSYEQAPTWSPDGTLIAFARLAFGRESLRASIVVANADGSHERALRSERLTRLGATTPSAWSPDGSALLFTRTVLDRHSYFRPSLYSIRVADGSERLIARDGGEGSYAPDGSRIAFISIRDRNGDDCGSDECSYDGELYVMAADGSGLTRLTRTKVSEESPAWSPDGARIAFASERNFPAGLNPEVYSVAPDGSCLTWLTNGSLPSRSPAWEPGASLSSDPGACGHAGRPPLLGVDVNAAVKGARRTFRPYWLGPVFGTNLLLSDASAEHRSFDLSYDDCASFDPAACPHPVEIFQTSTCALHPLLYGYGNARRLHALGGALVFRGAGGGYDVFTGTTAINVFGVPRGSLKLLLRTLRPVGAGTPPVRLPPPAFGRNVWARVDRAARAFRRFGSIAAAARRLRVKPSVVRKRLVLGQRLRAAGAGRRRCAPGDRPDT
jgi:Tol biopolymer transport system component